MPKPEMKLVGKGFYGGAYLIEDVSDDQFIHFTTPERAKEILDKRKILFRPPYPKFGPDAVYAISTTFGEWRPGVQTTHIKAPELVAVLFKTNVDPKAGYPEEVVWEKDVPLTSAKIIPVRTAQRILQSIPRPKGAEPGKDYEVYYGRVPEWIKPIPSATQKMARKIAAVVLAFHGGYRTTIGS